MGLKDFLLKIRQSFNENKILNIEVKKDGYTTNNIENKKKGNKIDNGDRDKSENRNKKTTENLIVYIVIIIITIVAINYIWNDKKDNKLNKKTTEYSKSLADKTEDIIEINKNKTEDISEDLENILSNIKGVGKVKVLITYSQTSRTIPMYSEDLSEKITEESDSGRRN